MRQDLLPWMQENVPANVRGGGTFTELLTSLLLEFDRGLAPSSHTLKDLEWACQADARLQTACLWGACKCLGSSGGFWFLNNLDVFFISLPRINKVTRVIANFGNIGENE